METHLHDYKDLKKEKKRKKEKKSAVTSVKETSIFLRSFPLLELLQWGRMMSTIEKNILLFGGG